jgi:pimeloyl-ACP methyl ester carboxylesterase
VEALLDALPEGEVSLVGVSFGGMIAQEIAGRGRVEVAALITCGSPAKIGMPERAIIQGRISEALEFGMVHAADKTIPRWFTTTYAGSPMAQSVRRRLATNRLEDWTAGWRAIQDFDGLDGLRRIGVATLAIAGECDSATSVSDVEAVVAAIPRATLAIMKGAPHMMQLEQPDAFFGLVDEFLRTRKS